MRPPTHFRFFPSLAIVLAVISGNALHASNCRPLYTEMGELKMEAIGSVVFQPKLGSRARTTPEGIFYVLGRGPTGGVMYRVVPKEAAGETYLWKEYDSAGRRDADLKLLELLHELHEGNEGPGFLIPKAKMGTKIYVFRTPYSIRMDDVAGRDLHSLLGDASVPEVFKAKLRREYERRLEALSSLLEKKMSIRSAIGDPPEIAFMDEKLDGTKCLKAVLTDPKSGQTIAMILKSDNVIVHYDSTNERVLMTVIDPH